MPPSDRQREQGFDAFRRGDFAAARRLLAPAAMAGEPQAALYAAESAFRMGEGSSARYFVDRLLAAAAPEDAHMSGAAVVLIKMGDSQTAERLLTQSAKSHPDWLGVRLELVALYLMTGRASLAEPLLQQMEGAGAEQDLLDRLRADTLRALGDVEGARAAYAHCLKHTPDDPALAEVAAYLSNLSPQTTARDVFEAHAKFGRLLERGVMRLPARPLGPADAERRLRVAFVSDNFAAHSVAHFLTAPLKHLDRGEFEVWGVSTNAIEDSTTHALSAMCDRYVRLPGVTPHDLAKRLHVDKVDVVIDLNGLTAGHRLGAFTMRPAPLAVTWLAYPSTTGLTSIDLRIADSITDPPGTGAGEGAGAMATERLVRLDPCFVCFTPLYDAEAAKVAAAPIEPSMRSHVAFACFNNAAKITDAALAAWGAVLSRVAGSRLLIKGRGLASERARTALTDRARRIGLDPSRLEVLAETPTVAAHLETYRRADVQLDTFPYNGTTTTCESLLMGVPVVTLRGEEGRHAARVGASLLTAAGLEDLIANDEADYVARAVTLARDPQRLRDLRSGLPSRLLSSPLCNVDAFAARFGAALRSAWRERTVRA